MTQPDADDVARRIAAEICTADPLTEEEVAELRERLEAAMQEPPRWEVLPPRFLTEDQLRRLLAECVTVIKPGETLVLRMGRQWTPSQMREVADMLQATIEYGELPFKAIVVPADDLGVVQADTDEAFANRVAKANAALAMRQRFPMRRSRG